MQDELEAPRAELAAMLTVEQLRSTWQRGEPAEFGDPALARTCMPLRKTFFPLGFPVELATNSSEVLEAAAQSWGSFPRLFDTAPIQINVGVTVSHSLVCPPTPICRVRDHLITNIADGENFAISDLASGYSLVWVTTAALRDRGYLRYFFLESPALCNIEAMYATAIHAGCVALHGNGVLLCGDSGAGKSTLAYACARAGWTYVTDDGSYLVQGRDDRLVVGNPTQVRFRPNAAKLFPELHSYRAMQRAGVGKPSVELVTNGHPSLATCTTAIIHQIVFLNRKSRTQELVAFPTAMARLYMMQRINAVPYSAPLHEQVIDRLLRVGAYELRYHDLEWAVERLAMLEREGR